MKKPKPQKAIDEITIKEGAEIVGVTGRTIERWAADSQLPAPIRPGVYNRTEFFRAVCALLQNRQSVRAKLDAQRLAKLDEETQRLERDRLKDTGDWLDKKVWLDKIGTHIGELRQALKTLLLTELPATLSGRSEADIREINQKTYTALCRRMQNAAGKLSPDTPAS